MKYANRRADVGGKSLKLMTQKQDRAYIHRHSANDPSAILAGDMRIHCARIAGKTQQVQTGEDKTDDEGVCMATCASPKRVRAQRNMRRAFGQGHRAAMNHSSAWWHEDSFTRSRHTGEVLQRFSPRQQIWSAPDPLPLHVLPRTEMER